MTRISQNRKHHYIFFQNQYPSFFPKIMLKKLSNLNFLFLRLTARWQDATRNRAKIGEGTYFGYLVRKVKRVALECVLSEVVFVCWLKGRGGME